MCFAKYFVFEGRAPRAEYWFFMLFYFLVGTAVDIVSAGGGGTIFAIGSGLFGLAMLVPSIPAAVRRLHDTDRSGGWCFLVFLPFVGWILLSVWLCMRGTAGPNRYGAENP